jgi:hypothetical protein
MVKWTLVYTKQAQKDAKKIAKSPQLGSDAIWVITRNLRGLQDLGG